MIAAQRSAIVAHDPGTRLGRDSESLHQMRVGVRRLRALLREAAPLLDTAWVEPLRAELEWLGDELGAVRDLDVFRENLAREVSELEPVERAGGARLLRALDADRRRARSALLAALRGERYLKLLASLDEAAAARPVAEGGADALAGLAADAFRFAGLRKKVDDLGEEPTDAELHGVRIKVKRARYAAELASLVAGKPARRFIAQAKKLQDSLDYQDAVTAQERLRSLATKVGDAAVSLVAGRLLERETGRRAQLLERFLKALAQAQRRGGKLSR